MNQLKLNKKQKNKQKITLTLKELQAVKDNATQKAVKITHLFQFIQWEDEEPYNIQELIDEYEKEYHIKNAKIVNIDASKISGNASDYKHFYKRVGESEETEVKKQEVIKNIKSLARETSQQWPHEEMVELPDVLREIDQLDEPEVLSQEWVDEHAEHHEYIGYAGVPVEDLQNLLVPKQEELEVKIQELIETYKQEDGAYSNPENGWISGFIEDLKNLLEEERKYYVLDKKGNLLIRGYSNGSVGRVGDRMKPDLYPDWNKKNLPLTEQEIKDYDERFWPFAVKVEELED